MSLEFYAKTSCEPKRILKRLSQMEKRNASKIGSVKRSVSIFKWYQSIHTQHPLAWSHWRRRFTVWGPQLSLWDSISMFQLNHPENCKKFDCATWWCGRSWEGYENVSWNWKKKEYYYGKIWRGKAWQPHTVCNTAEFENSAIPFLSYNDKNGRDFLASQCFHTT